MKKKGIFVFLCFLLSCGLAMIFVRNIALDTVLRGSWYSEIRSEVYYVERVTSHLNFEISKLMKEYYIPDVFRFKLLTSKEIQNYYDYRAEYFCLMTVNRSDENLKRLNDQTKEDITYLVNDYFILLENGNVLMDEDEIKELTKQIEYFISSYLIKVNDLTDIEDVLFYQILFFFTSPQTLILSGMLIVFALSGFIFLPFFTRSDFISIFRSIGLMTWLLLTLGRLIHKPQYISPAGVTFLDEEFLYAGMVNVSKRGQYLSQHLFIISLIIIAVECGIKQYVQLKVSGKRDIV